MEISKEKNGTTLTVSLSGKLDTSSSTELEAVIREDLEGIFTLIIDMKEISYVSSAGLRVLMAAHKRMHKVGTMKLTNVCEDVKEILDMTGLLDFLAVED